MYGGVLQLPHTPSSDTACRLAATAALRCTIHAIQLQINRVSRKYSTVSQ